MKPIIFSTEMVKAVLEGRKTQTRRVIKVQPSKEGMRFSTLCSTTDSERRKNIDKHFWQTLSKDELNVLDSDDKFFSNPYGKVGDRLWVRETFSTLHYKPIYKDEKIIEDQPIDKIIKDYGIRWSPSIFMPKEYCRTTLEITDIRVERVRDISEDDAIGEGCDMIDNSPEREIICAKSEFKEIWDSINKKRGYGWEVNPWVWVVCFKVVKK